MTLAEFKAWLEGYSEAIGEAPNAEQWKRIQAKLATVGIDGIGLGALKQPQKAYPASPNILIGGMGGYVPQTLTSRTDFVRDWETVAISN
jgi:hypothetical protein